MREPAEYGKDEVPIPRANHIGPKTSVNVWRVLRPKKCAVRLIHAIYGSPSDLQDSNARHLGYRDAQKTGWQTSARGATLIASRTGLIRRHLPFPGK
jgi:hypothetical protein